MDPAGEICVALVDDDESVCRSLGRLLRAAGIRAVPFASAEAFLAAPASPEVYDCLILDLRLEGMSGLDLGRRLAARGCTTPFILVTAHEDDGTRVEAARAGCAAYFRKTDPGAGVIQTIRRLARAPRTAVDPVPSCPQDAP